MEHNIKKKGGVTKNGDDHEDRNCQQGLHIKDKIKTNKNRLERDEKQQGVFQ